MRVAAASRVLLHPFDFLSDLHALRPARTKLAEVRTTSLTLDKSSRPRLAVQFASLISITSLTEKTASVAERHLGAPAANRSTNMSAPIYPIHLRRDFEQRWAARTACGKARRSPPEGRATCVCGEIVTAPSSSTYSPDEVANYWECSACGKRWKTIAPSHPAGYWRPTS